MKTSRSRFKPRNGGKVRLGARKARRVSLRENAAATAALFETAGIGSAGRRDRVAVLKLGAARLDDVELESALAAALRGDYTVASSRLGRTVKLTHVPIGKRKPKGWSPWRNRLLARRKGKG